MAENAETPSAFRPGGVSYLRIPAPDVQTTAAFYEAVFHWRLRGDPEEPGFDDATGHVIGHFMPDLTVAGDAGFQPFIYVDRLAATVEAVVEQGGEVMTPPYPEGDLWVAVFRDPVGNVVGAWQHGPLG
jgi:uncharacterized protein